ncbi:MAG TPA: hypothetical protein VHC69_33970 [Polyangiaceae bacterium]|nr:hypothetical protein [Polyangiaceae bacterium]
MRRLRARRHQRNDEVVRRRLPAGEKFEAAGGPLPKDLGELWVDGDYPRAVRLQGRAAVLRRDIEAPEWLGAVVEIAPAPPADLSLAHAGEEGERV